VAGSFAAGILLTEYAHIPLTGWLALALPALILGIGGLFFRRAGIATIGVLLGFCAAGGAIYHYRCVRLPPGHIAEIVSDDPMLMRVRGYVCTDPVSRRKAPLGLSEGSARRLCETALDLKLNAIMTNAGPRPACGKIKVKLYEDNPGIQFGDEVILTGRIEAPGSPTNPSQFNYRQYLRRLGIRAVLRVPNAAGVEWTGRSTGRVRRSLFGVRRYLLSLISTPGNGRGGKVLAAMLLGAREELPPDTVERFRQSGTMHLLAISGLHVGMVAGAIWLVAGLVGADARLRSIAVVLCVVAYVLLTGARPPAVRAAVMIGLVALGGAFARRQVTVNSLALAAFIILVFSPGEIFMRGFQLSFVAVLCIVYFYRPIIDLLNKLKVPLEDLQAPEERSLALRGWIAGKKLVFPCVSVSVAASIGVLPLIAHTFHIVSLIGVVCNAILVPLASLVVWLGLAGLAAALPLSLVWAGAGMLVKPAVGGALLLDRAAALAARAPGSYFYTAGPPLWFLLSYYAVLLLIVHRRILRLTPRRCAVVFVILVNTLAVHAAWPDRGNLNVTCFDVRHGTCVLFDLPSGETLLYDCGTASMFFDVGSYIVAPELWRRGIRRIDALILSHSDADHMNGAFSLLKRFKIAEVFHPPGFRNNPLGALLLREIDDLDIAHRDLVAGEVLKLGDATIDVLNPPGGPVMRPGSDPNNESLVVRVNCSGKRFLLCGDIQAPAIRRLLASGHNLRAEVILMPHHGSHLSNVAGLLEAVEPEAAIMSCERGYVQRSLIESLRAHKIRAFQTARCGAVRITVEEGRLKIDPCVRPAAAFSVTR